MRQLQRSLLLIISLAVLPGTSAQAPDTWRTIGREDLCVTEGQIEAGPERQLKVDVPKMRAYATIASAQSVEARFAYLGPTAQDVPLPSGEMRRQFGMKLRAQDPCNLVYVMWRIEPTSQLMVSVKRNPNQQTSAECGNKGYWNVRPAKSSPVPSLGGGKFHTLRAEMKGADLRVLVDNQAVWTGNVGSEAASLDGPVGIRSDNAQIALELQVRRAESHSAARSCNTAVGSD